MILSPEQESVLNGKSGQALSLAMKTLVQYGRAFRAERLVPVKSAHLAGSFGAFAYKVYYRIIDRLLAEGLRVKVPTTINPRPGAKLNLVNRLLFSRQKHFERQMEQLGVTPNYSCVCYDSEDAPALGDRLAWAESSAVQYANAVLGARTNRNSVLLDICSAVTGLTPEFGYLLDENRRGSVLVKLRLKKMDASALGFVLGQRLVNQIPVIEHYDFARAELKNMGGAMAAAGAVATFHVEGVTPEAPDLQTAFDGEPQGTMTISQQDLDEIRDRSGTSPDLVVFGCPQMTLEEAVETARVFDGRSCKTRVWFCLAPHAAKQFRETSEYGQASAAGIEVYEHCPVAALTVRTGLKNVLTTSGKVFYYLARSRYGSEEDCLRACGVLS